MIGEWEIGGVFVPQLLIVAIVAFVVTLVTRRVFRRLRLYRFVWHAGLFDTALFIIFLWLTAVITNGPRP
jgi:uncharacterized membrane protein YvlD (DUF360 family)